MIWKSTLPKCIIIRVIYAIENIIASRAFKSIWNQRMRDINAINVVRIVFANSKISLKFKFTLYIYSILIRR